MEDVPPDISWSKAFALVIPPTYSLMLGRRGVPPRALPAVAIGWGALVYGLSRAFPEHSRAVAAAGAAAAGVPAALFLLLTGYISRGMSRNRMGAFKSARNLLLRRIGEGRAKRRRGYDLYLPPDKVGKEVVGLVFLPGASVEHTAYACVAAALSDEGVVVVVVNLEPLRFASDSTGADSTDILKIMYEVMSGDEGLSVSEWGLGGHSAGASAAFNVTQKMRPGVSKLVMCGSKTPMALIGTLHDSATNVVVINGTEDGLLNYVDSKSRSDLFKAKLPPEKGNGRGGRTSFVTIEGGNHSGFGHYGPQVYPIKDKDRTITLEQQQKAFVQAMADLLLERQK